MKTRNFTVYFGLSIILISILRVTGVLDLSRLTMASISAAALAFALVDLMEEFDVKQLNETNKTRIVVWLDFVAIIIIAISIFAKNILPFYSAFILQNASDFLTLLAFGCIFLTIGIREKKYITSTIDSYEHVLKLKEMDRFPTLDSETARKSMVELAKCEYSTVFKLNKVVLKLKKIDNFVQRTGTVHDGWGFLHDTFDYYTITGEEPFYDHGLNDSFWNFFREIHYGSEMFANLSGNHLNDKLATMKVEEVDFDVTQFSLIRNHKSDEEYKEAYAHIKQALGYWDEIMQISRRKFESYSHFE